MELNWKIAGRAGEGIAATSFLMSKICQRAGLSVFEYSEYPSLIRGGHTGGQVHAGDTPTFCQKKLVDVMVVLNEDAIAQHLSEFSDKTKFLIDTQDDHIDFGKYPSIHQDQIISVPMVQISREQTGKSLASNMVALAVSCHIFGLDQEVLHDVIHSFFGRKGDEVVSENIRAAEAGYKFSIENLKQPTANSPASPAGRQQPTKKLTTYLLNGSEAIGYGALSAGVQYYCAYPMTPASTLMTFFADAQEHFPIVVKHVEDEIAAINNALGASFAGVRAMTGTAGGGFALMEEGVSLAGVTELPLVTLVGGRPGPATGLPTWTSQTDLSFVLNAGHGEFPKVVFTPGNLEECFTLTRLSFEIAEKYHTQVYIIADKLLLESKATIESTKLPSEFDNARFSFAQDPLPEDNSYRRFLDTPEGYSPRSIPGQPHGLQLTNSYEHDAYGWATEDGQTAQKMVEKRLRKHQGIIKETPPPILIGPDDAPVTFVTWGSSRLALEEVIKQTSANIIHIRTMMPFHREEFLALTQKAHKLVMVEENIMRQGEMLIKQETGLTFDHRINRYDGRPLYAEEILEHIKSI